MVGRARCHAIVSFTLTDEQRTKGELGNDNADERDVKVTEHGKAERWAREQGRSTTCDGHKEDYY